MDSAAQQPPFEHGVNGIVGANGDNGTGNVGFRIIATNGNEIREDVPRVVSPPYWQSRNRTNSKISIDTIPRGAIILRDNTDGEDDRNSACWAKSVHIDDFVVVNGGTTGIGSFVVWNVRVETLEGGSIHLRKRYSEFDDLRLKLLQTFPRFEAAMPPLPPKSVISKFRPKFLEHRRIGLSYFLK